MRMLLPLITKATKISKGISLINGLLCFLIKIVLGLKILPILNRMISLKQQIPDAVLILKIEWFQTDNIVVVEYLPELVIKTIILITVLFIVIH